MCERVYIYMREHVRVRVCETDDVAVAVSNKENVLILTHLTSEDKRAQD